MGRGYVSPFSGNRLGGCPSGRKTAVWPSTSIRPGTYFRWMTFPARLTDSPKPVGIAPVTPILTFLAKGTDATETTRLPTAPALPNLTGKVKRKNVKCFVVACEFAGGTYGVASKNGVLMPEKTRRQQLEEMLAEDPNDEFLRYGLGMEYMSSGEHDSAVRIFRELIAQNPARPYIPAIQMAAQTLLKVGRRKEAIPLLKQGIEEARKQNQLHPMDEMQALLDSVE